LLPLSSFVKGRKSTAQGMENSGVTDSNYREKTDGTSNVNQHQNEMGRNISPLFYFFVVKKIQNPPADKVDKIHCAASDRIHDRTLEDIASLFCALPYMPRNKPIK
jgi:hypothetical protein